jgi:hypothetical protein
MMTLVMAFDFENFMRIHLTIKQALGAGMSAVNIVLQAIKAYPQHEIWEFLNQNCPAKIANFKESVRFFAKNQLARFW